MGRPILSYVLTTFNKLEYLKVTLPFLLQACGEDEEIVIVDAQSSDGTTEYLSSLFQQGKIHQFISEKDTGEAHGTNKAVLMAKGDLIKIITDDDLYSFDQIQECKAFMMQHTSIDILGTDGYAVNFISAQSNDVVHKQDLGYFQEWLRVKTPFIITGLSLMIRKSSLPLLGLFNTNFVIVDFEYALRITSGKARLAWYTGCTYVNIVNANSNSDKYWARLNEEKRKLDWLYNRRQYFFRNLIIQLRISLGSAVRKVYSRHENPVNTIPYPEIFMKAKRVIEEFNKNVKGKFHF